MNNFYEVLPYLLIFAQAIGAAVIARRLANSSFVRSRWAIASVAALPIPVLLAGFAVFAFLVVGRLAECEANSCAGEREAFATLLIAALCLFTIGVLTALLATRPRKKSSNSEPV